VREAAVVVREDEGRGKELIGYVVIEEGSGIAGSGMEGEEIAGGEIRRRLRERVPEYMVPGRVIVLEAMPLTPNGKLDRQALLSLEVGPLTSSVGFVAPRTATEVRLARIWSEMLKAKEVGVHDNFFELGGHSLLATQVLSRVRDILQVEVSLRRLFETPTIAELADYIDKLQPSQPDNLILPLERSAGETELPLSFAQERLWFLDQLQPGKPFYNIPIAVSLKGRLDVGVIEKVLNEIIERHEVLRTYFKEREGTATQAIVASFILKLSVVDLTHLPDDEREGEARRLAAEEARRPFNLSRLPLLRASLLRLSETEHLILLTLHHIISDGWSMSVLIKEVAALYEAYRRGEQSPLPELAVQYGDYAVWQREWLQGEVLEQQLAYWREQLSGAAQLELPTDRPRPPVQSFRGAYEPVLVPQNVAEKLKVLGEAEGVTPFMVLLSIFNLMLSYYTKQDDIVVGTDIANRNRTEVEGLIGFFINQLVLRSDLSGNPSFRELLGRLKAVTLDAYTHQETPFALLVNAVKRERTLSHAPLFQCKFVLQSMPQQTLELPDLTLQLLSTDYVSAKLDLTLLLEETPEGFRGNMEYSTDLFEKATVNRMAKHFVALLEEALAQPDSKISELKSRLMTIDKRAREVEEEAIKNLQLRKLRSIRPKKMKVTQEDLVVKDLLRQDEALPLVVRPASEDVDPVSWAAANRPSIEAELLKHGAILFRDFKIDLSAQLEPFALSLCSELFNENGEHPRELVSGNV
jgi:acyl carrier protein